MADNLNLTPDRGPNVWDKQQHSDRDRWKSEVSGAVMLAAGAAAAFVGGRMLYRAVREARPEALSGRDPDSRLSDVVGEVSAQSFPASDSPSWTPTSGANTEKGERWR
jgi:hypothetical protein